LGFLPRGEDRGFIRLQSQSRRSSWPDQMTRQRVNERDFDVTAPDHVSPGVYESCVRIVLLTFLNQVEDSAAR
jgi:hypothetical protein